MEPNSGQAASESFRAQALIYKHALNYGTSFCLSFAIQLGIPDVIHRHAQPMTLPELVSALQLSPEKTIPLRRVMALLVHSGFFSVNFNKEQKEEYSLTPSSRLLLRGELSSLSPFVQVLVHPVLSNPWRFLGDWFRGCKEQTVFETAHGVGLWDYCGKDPGFNGLFNEGMASDSRMMRLVVGDRKEIFEGVNSLVDVGGGTGNVAKIILQAFPHIKCTVFDLPHVVSGLPEDTNLSYVGGDLFESIPPADAILFKMENKDNALTVLGSNTSAATFLASVSLTLSSLIGAWIANNSNIFQSSIIYGDTRPSTMSIKFISLLICFILAFSCFVQSARCFIHANYLVSISDSKMPINYVELPVIRGGEFWSLGLRALYFAIDLLLWFFGPIPMFATSVAMVVLLHYLDTNTTPLHNHRRLPAGKPAVGL